MRWTQSRSIVLKDCQYEASWFVEVYARMTAEREPGTLSTIRKPLRSNLLLLYGSTGQEKRISASARAGPCKYWTRQGCRLRLAPLDLPTKPTKASATERVRTTGVHVHAQSSSLPPVCCGSHPSWCPRNSLERNILLSTSSLPSIPASRLHFSLCSALHPPSPCSRAIAPLGAIAGRLGSSAGARAKMALARSCCEMPIRR